MEELYLKTSKHKLYFEQQEKHLRVGKKVFELIGKHKHQENNKLLNLAVKKLIAIEKNKVLSEEKPIAIAKEVEAVKIEEPKSKKQSKPAKQKPKEKPTEKIKVGDRVKIEGYNKSGEVSAIKNNKAEVIMGNFNIKVNLSDLVVIY